MSGADPLDDAALRSIVIDVARLRSMSAAARLHGLSQPTVRSHIDRAERAAGRPLFCRTVQGTLPTPDLCCLIRAWREP